MAAIAGAWLRTGRTMEFETVDWATSKPSIRSSPWMRDAPHFGFSLLIRPMRSRRPRSIFGRPAFFRDFQRQNALKPARRHRRMVSGLNDLCRTEQARPRPSHPYQQRSVTAAQSKTERRTPQGDAELMAKKQVLGFKPAPRLERVDNEHSQQVQDWNHWSQSCDDSAYDANPGRMEFSERTASTSAPLLPA